MQRRPRDTEEIRVPTMKDNETWNDCPNCGAKWKDEISIPGILHRTRLCDKCRKEAK